jgi:acetyl esterase/lipase
MKCMLLFILITLSMVKAESQIIIHNGETGRMRYCSRPGFSVDEIKIVSGNYADAPNNTDTSFNFKIFFPDTAKDNLGKRPFILLIHGGEYEVGSLGLNENLSQQFAMRGFIAATINYRLSQWQNGNCLSSDTLLLWQNYYRSMQDTRAALRYFVHHDMDFRIDTSWVFVGGQSAGAITSLAVAFQDQQETDAITGPQDLGDLDHADNSFTDHFTIKGVLNEFGALKYTDDIDADENIPVISMHAQNDPLVPYAFNSLAWGQCGNAYQFVNGSAEIQHRLLSLGICAELDSSPSAKHVNLVSDDYVARHASCFFNRVMSNDCEPDTFTIEDNIKPECCFKTIDFIRTLRTAQYDAAGVFYSQHQLVIEIAADGNDFSAEVFNVWGMQIAQFNDLRSGENILPIELPAGIYFIAINHDRHPVITKKLICIQE